jgi:hypothetical protein
MTDKGINSGMRRSGSGGQQYVMTAGVAGRSDPEADDPEIRFYFARLMQVAINNTFYNTTGSLSPDFAVVPTRKTQSTMKSLSLLFRDAGAGFAVLYDTTRKPVMVDYLRWHAPLTRNDADDGTETRLSFALNLRNPNFYYFTDIPFDIDVGSQCYYLSNQMAHTVDGRIVLNENEFVPQSEPLPTVESEYNVPFPQDATAIEVLDVCGKVVLCYPRLIPVDLLKIKLPNFISCDDVTKYLQQYPDASMRGRDNCTINFYLLPAGRYTVHYVGGAEPDLTFIYRAENYLALCLIDLFLTDPTRGGPGIYPVRDVDSKDPPISDVDYNLNFSARSTCWEYLIVPPAKGAQLHDLRITGTDRNGDQVKFTPAEPISIGLDTTAYRSVSEAYLQIQSSSECDFKLTGRIQHAKGVTTRDSTLMPRLPVAPANLAAPVPNTNSPSNSDDDPRPVVGPTYGQSAIYVYL